MPLDKELRHIDRCLERVQGGAGVGRYTDNREVPGDTGRSARPPAARVIETVRGRHYNLSDDTYVAYHWICWGKVMNSERGSVDGALAIDDNSLGDAFVAERVTTRPSGTRFNEW